MTSTALAPSSTRPDTVVPSRPGSPAAFVALAFALSWAVWIPVIVARPQAGQIVAMVGAFGPAVAAALLVRRQGASIRQWLRELVFVRVPARWYAVALAIPVGLVAAQAGAAAAAGVPPSLSELPVRLVSFLFSVGIAMLVGGGQEEPGWRGWLQPALQRRLGALAASAVVGVVWAAWHLPLFILGVSFYADLQFALYLPTLIGLSVIATALWNRTASIVVVMVLHAAVNASAGLLPIDAAAAADLQLAGQVVLSIAVLITAGVLVWRLGPKLGGPAPAPHGVPASGLPSPARQPVRRRVGQFAAAVLALACVAIVAQESAEWRGTSPPPGELIELSDGRRLHLLVAGEQHDGPTVVLFGGAGASVAAWAWVQPAVAEHATVVAYDRPGLGWSDEGGSPNDVGVVVADLRDALRARGLPGPYLLVGHSLGAHHARAFAAAHPDEVAGVVLVDPSHPAAGEVLGFSSDSMQPMATIGRAAARLGVFRVYRAMEAELHGLPEPARAQALAQQRSTAYWRTFGPEMVTLDEVGAALPTAPGVLGDVPLRVLIATGGATDEAQQQVLDDLAELREGLAALSSHGTTTTLSDATHVSIVTDPTHAASVVDAIVGLLEE